MQTKSQLGTILAWNVPRCGATVSNCSLCADFAKKQPMEPLKPTALPSLPWQKIGTDLLEF